MKEFLQLLLLVWIATAIYEDFKNA